MSRNQLLKFVLANRSSSSFSGRRGLSMLKSEKPLLVCTPVRVSYMAKQSTTSDPPGTSTGEQQHQEIHPPIDLVGVKVISESKVSSLMYRCSVNDPLKHSKVHQTKFYEIKADDMEVFDPFKENLRKNTYEEWKAFNESCLMIRQPAIEIMGYLKNINVDMPSFRFVLYGNQEGTGKRSVLFHLLHHCYKDNLMIINLPDCSNVLRFDEEKQPSTYKEGRWDTPLDAMKFIKRFAKQNMHLLKNLNLKTTKNYTWAPRDSTPEGTPLIDLFAYAESKVKYSSDICSAIIREIKIQNKEKNFKVLVTFDQLNSYFGPTRLHMADRTEIQVDEITIVRAFKKLLKSDWSNSASVGIVNSHGVIIPAPNRRTKFYDMTIPWNRRRRVESKCHYEGPLTPFDLLKTNGFAFLEPFIPIEVPIYSIQEATNHFEYYKDRNWLSSPEARSDDGREEIFFLSSRNPSQFVRVCQSI